MHLKIKLGNKITVLIILGLIALFSLIFLGFTGFKVMFGMLLVFFLPFYLILDNFNLSRSEKVIFSFFIGVGVFPAIVYWLGVLISFRISIVLAFFLLITVAFFLKKYKKTKSDEDSRQ